MQRLDDLIVFVSVVERGSFIAAARQLNLPAGTVSRKVQDLEERLGTKLLRRTTRQLSLTEAGQAVHEKAARGLGLIRDAELAAQSQGSEPRGTLRILAPYTVGTTLMEPVLRTIIETHPKIQIQITLNNDHLDLVEHGFDIAIRTGHLKDSAYAVRRIFTGPRSIFASPEYLASGAPIKSLDDLRAHNLIALGTSQPQGMSYTFCDGSEHREVALFPRMLTNEIALVLQHVLHGAGFAVLPNLLCQPYLEDNKLVNVLPAWKLEDELTVSAMFEQRATADPKIRLFVDLLVSLARQRLPSAQKAS